MLGPLQLEELPVIPVRVGDSGTPGENRTPGLAVRSRTLFTLSYRGKVLVSLTRIERATVVPETGALSSALQRENIVWRKREDLNLCGLAAHPLSRRRR